MELQSLREKARFYFQWWNRLHPLCIATKEMIPTVVTAAIFRREWPDNIIEFCVDNIHAVNTIFCSESHLMHLIRLLLFLCHTTISGLMFLTQKSETTLADALSRNNLQHFFSHGLPAPCTPAPVPQPLLTIVHVVQNITWISTTRIKLFTTTLPQLSVLQPTRPTKQWIADTHSFSLTALEST